MSHETLVLGSDAAPSSRGRPGLVTGLVVSLALAASTTLFAQSPAPAQPPAPAATQAPAAAPGQPSVQTATVAARASWFIDRRALRVGDLVTVVVDESVNASEREQNRASAARASNMGLGINIDDAVRLGPKKAFQTQANHQSQNDGQAGRTGDLTAVIAVRVTLLEPTGIARIEGERTITVDGRNQVVKLAGVIRPEDVNADNTVASSRIADAVISYKGKKMSPSKGILGSILSIFWP
ncbi:MAG: flagellar basal body L-ring protein FlgH [Gemmatimonadota bacterium]